MYTYLSSTPIGLGDVPDVDGHPGPPVVVLLHNNNSNDNNDNYNKQTTTIIQTSINATIHNNNNSTTTTTTNNNNNSCGLLQRVLEYGVRAPVLCGNLREQTGQKTVFHENPEEARDDLTGVCENLQKPPNFAG